MVFCLQLMCLLIFFFFSKQTIFPILPSSSKLAKWRRYELKFSATEDCCEETTGTKDIHYCQGDMRYHFDVGKYHGDKQEKFTECCNDK